MKNLILTVSIFFAFAFFSESNAQTRCMKHDIASENRGKCRTLSSGAGSMCFRTGSGWACHATGIKFKKTPVHFA